MANYFKETIERITEQTIEQEVRSEIKDIKDDAIKTVESIKVEAIENIKKIETDTIGEDGNGGEVNKIKSDSLEYIDKKKKELAEFGNESKAKANEIYNDICTLNADTDSIVDDTISKIEYNIREMLVNNWYIVKAFHDDDGDVHLELQIFDGVHYVSLGDSIAAGHTINEDWATDYGEDSQYGKNGNTSTAIVPNSYTDRIRNELVVAYGDTYTSTNSFARSGDTVADLIDKLDHEVVIKAIEKADIVTICIGANDVLQPALSHLGEYINAGDSELENIASIVENNLAILGDDSAATSYTALFNKLKGINSNARYVFTTIYNPYKYLWIDEGQGGFFAPLLNTIPSINLFGFDITSIIKNGLLGTSVVQMLFDRINGLDSWSERYVTSLNQVLKNKIEKADDNFLLADTKAIFDSVPDRPYSATYHYNDLVSVEYTRGYDTAQMDWGALWRSTHGDNVAQYWIDLATKYVSTSGIDLEGFAAELINQLVEKVIVPDIDPHPETYGHYVLKRSFYDALGANMLSRYSVVFSSNGGSGSMSAQQVVGIDDVPAFVNLNSNMFSPQEGYHFVGWNTKADGSGTSYSDNQLISITSDIVLYAQWSNICTVTYKHTNHTNLYGSDETGHKECYALYINGELKPKFGTFASGSSTTYQVPYGSTIKVWVDDYVANEITYDSKNCNIYMNGNSVASGHPTEYTFTLTGNTTIDFRWKIAGSLATFDAQSWEDCYITTG